MKIKICGVKTLEAAQAARAGGADFIGLIFAEKSPRKIETHEAEKISSNLKGAKLVGVFQNQSEDFILKIQKRLKLFAIQLHGNEGEAFAKSLAKKDESANMEGVLPPKRKRCRRRRKIPRRRNRGGRRTRRVGQNFKLEFCGKAVLAKKAYSGRRNLA